MDDTSKKHELVINSEHASLRLDAFLAQHFPDISRSQIQKQIDSGSVLVNNNPQKKRYHVHEGDRVEIIFSDQSSNSSFLTGENIPLDIVYEDEYLIAVNKPAGLVVHPGHGNKTGTLVQALIYRGGDLAAGFSIDRPGIVHRLDKDTSGLLLVAKNDSIHAKLASLFAERKVDKQYLGFCIGRRPPEHAIIDQAIGRSKTNPMKRSIREDGKAATTEYWLLDHQKGISLLRFKLHTGRTHQIRVHSAYAGIPVLHDEEYGGGESSLQRIQPLERPFAYKIYKCFNRHALHAWKLGIIHPKTKKKLTLEAPLPEDFKKALAAAGWKEPE